MVDTTQDTAPVATETADPFAIWAKDYATSEKYLTADPNTQAAVKKAFFKKYVLPISGLENLDKAALEFKFATSEPSTFYSNPEFMKLDEQGKKDILAKNLRARGIDPEEGKNLLGGQSRLDGEWLKMNMDPGVGKLRNEANLMALGAPVRGAQQTVASLLGNEEASQKLAKQTQRTDELQEYFPGTKGVEIGSQIATTFAPGVGAAKGGQIVSALGKGLGPVKKAAVEIGGWLAGALGVGGSAATTDNVRTPEGLTPEQTLAAQNEQKKKSLVVNTIAGAAPEVAFGAYKGVRALGSSGETRAAQMIGNTTESMAPAGTTAEQYVPQRLDEIEGKLRGSESTAFAPVTAQSKELGAVANVAKFNQSPEAISKFNTDVDTLKSGIGQAEVQPQTDVTGTIDKRTAKIQTEAEGVKKAAEEAIDKEFSETAKKIYQPLRENEYKLPAGQRNSLAEDLSKVAAKSANPDEVLKIPGMTGFVTKKKNKLVPVKNLGKNTWSLGDLVETKRLMKYAYDKKQISVIHDDFQAIMEVMDKRIQDAVSSAPDPQAALKRVTEADSLYQQAAKARDTKVRESDLTQQQVIDRAREFDQRPTEKALVGANRTADDFTDALIKNEAGGKNFRDLAPEAKAEGRNSLVKSMQDTLDPTGKFESMNLKKFSDRFNTPQARRNMREALADDPDKLKLFEDTLKVADEYHSTPIYTAPKNTGKADEPTNLQDPARAIGNALGGRPSTINAVILNWRNALRGGEKEAINPAMRGGKEANEKAADLVGKAKKEFIRGKNERKAFDKAAPAVKGAAVPAISATQSQKKEEKGVLEKPDLPVKQKINLEKRTEASPKSGTTLAGRSPEDVKWAAKLAGVESSFGKNKKNPVSSAKGSTQIIKDTQKTIEKKAGRSFNLDDEKDALEAALVYRDMNKEELKDLDVKDGDLYAAHFLGASGFRKLHRQKENAVSAAKLLPKAAAANKKIFYDNKGRQRTPSQVLRVLNNKFNEQEKGSDTYIASL